MNDISTYTDYRLLLRDFYDGSKKKNAYFSYRVFSQRAGISSKGLLYNVVTGRRRLSPSHVAGVAGAMKLNKSEFAYFEHLVAFNNARSIEEKKRYFERMNSIKVTADDPSHPHLVRKEQYRFYSQWYHAVVRSLIDLYGFYGDYEKLAQMVYPAITAAQAKRSVALLENLGFIVKKADGGYAVVDKTITTAPEVISLAIHNYHLQTSDIARKALNELPREHRNFTGVTLGISETAFALVCKEIELFRERLLALAGSDSNENDMQRVYQLNLQLFSVSHYPDARSRR
ncbi:MAG: TIGR02147 family protein [Chitinispirillaceae bacterium]|nr:TIGR02147 family protein [Chitinispirillaceae bacterium]